MAGKFIIREGATFEPPAPAAPAAGALAATEVLFEDYACSACHTLDGTDEEIAPSFKGLFGATRTLVDGTTLVADEEVSGAFSFEFVGLADDSQGMAGSAMRTLKKDLEAEPLIARATVQPQGDEGSARRFKLTIVPIGNPTPEREDEE